MGARESWRAQWGHCLISREDVRNGQGRLLKSVSQTSIHITQTPGESSDVPFALWKLAKTR